MQLKVIVTGSTGMVGNAILRVCLDHPDIGEVLLLNRRTCGISHTKLKEIIHQDFFDLSEIEEQCTGYDACFYCLGVTSLFMPRKEYYHITHDLTVYFAKTLSRLNTNLSFCYVSGFGADASEKAKFMQAQVKGQAEVALLHTTCKFVYIFRPGLLKPLDNQSNIHNIYTIINPFYRLLRWLLPRFILTLEELALAMIYAVKQGNPSTIFEVKDIVAGAHASATKL